MAQAPEQRRRSPDRGRSPRPTTAAHQPVRDSDLPKIPSKLSPKATKEDEGEADASFKAETNVVNVDVQVLDNHGNPIPNIPRDNFRILEDNVPQTLTQFSVGEAPMTVAMVIEFSARFQAFYSSGWAETLTASYGFVQTLKPEDYVAIIAYDLRSTILSDFTNDRSKTMEAMQRLRIPGLFGKQHVRRAGRYGRPHVEDRRPQSDSADRLRHRHVQQAHLRQDAQEPAGIRRAGLFDRDAAGGAHHGGRRDGRARRISISCRRDNELRTFAKETGGQAFFPRFMGELPDVFQAISQSLRNQYSLGYSPNNQAKDGKFRKITVQLVNPERTSRCK